MNTLTRVETLIQKLRKTCEEYDSFESEERKNKMNTIINTDNIVSSLKTEIQ